MDAATRGFVRLRANHRCEYCQFRQQDSETPHHIEHIIARKHGGADHDSNLALACNRCNLHKASNLSGIDPLTGELVRLYHPRQDSWHEHFAWEAEKIIGISAIGRATVRVLALNHSRRLELRVSAPNE